MSAGRNCACRRNDQKKSPPANAPWQAANIQNVRSFSSRNKVFSMKRARRAVSTRSGHTVMCLTSRTIDMSERIEQQIERFAPGFRDCILARHSTNTAALEKSNANLSGGDINGGAANLLQFVARPVLSATPYRTPLRGIYLCSASTPPGGGVHGMCGYHAARATLRDIFGKK